VDGCRAAIDSAAAIAMITFNLADDRAMALAAIASDKGLLTGISTIHLVDQGTDLISARRSSMTSLRG
jgi:hypothetical protein